MGYGWRRFGVVAVTVACAVAATPLAAFGQAGAGEAVATGGEAAATGGEAAATGGGTVEGGAGVGVRAMWLWSAAPSDEVVAWATGHGVTEIMANVPAGPTAADLDRLRGLERLATPAGVRLSALGGDETWTFDHAAALAWQRDVAATGLFAAIHLDVEPYLLAEWNTDRNRTTAAYLALLGRLRAAGTLPLEADVPFWYGEIAVAGTAGVAGGDLATKVLDRVAAVTVMTYRDTVTGPNSIMDVGTDMLRRGSLAGKPVRLAVETQPLPDCPHCTFAEEGWPAMVGALTTVDGIADGYPAFAGIAVHHYDSWRGLAG